jgi:DNA repair and recombination protein RAD54B
LILPKEDYLAGKPFLTTSKRQSTSTSTAPTAFIPPAPVQTVLQFRTGLRKPSSNQPRHDPTAPEAIVLPPPKMPPDTKPIDVVLDPFIAKHLRPHQKEGVCFLYECIMGIKDFNGQGAILADEMGLGKTLTVIALIWTLLSTSKFHATLTARTISLPRRILHHQKSPHRLSRNSHQRILDPTSPT